MSRTLIFIKEPLRTPTTVALLGVVPVLFVVAASGALSEFADALGGSLASDAAIGLSAGWAAAFLSGAIGFFQCSSARNADRRLALAGVGAARVAISRIAASVTLALIASVAAFAALALRAQITHPLHVAVAILSFALLYLCIGVAVGSVVSAPLEGSLLVVFVFLLDVFSGPGMSAASKPWAISHDAAETLITAGLGGITSTADWLQLAAVNAAALLVALSLFVAASRSRQ